MTIAGLTANPQAVGMWSSRHYNVPAKIYCPGASNDYAVQFELTNFPPDGLVGMAFPALSVFGEPPLFTTLVDQGTTPPVFGALLTDTGSELFLGGVNPAKFTGAFRNVSLIEEVSAQIDPTKALLTVFERTFTHSIFKLWT